MRINGLEKEFIIVNPYRKAELDIQLLQVTQKDNISKMIENKDLVKKDLSKDIQKLSVSQEELNKLMEELRHKFNMLEKYLQIDIDRELDMPISKIIDMRTEEIIRQIPPEWMVEILRRMEELRGVFYSKEV